MLQDQISAGHPAAPFVVAPLLEAAGVLHAEPRLVVLRDGDSRLGEFEPEFGGMLGVLEERAEAGEGGTGFGGAAEVIGTDKLLERLERDADHLVDAPQFLRARMVDIFLGDWDRHRDQWRWARFGTAKPARWVPIPRDRDQAFARYDGRRGTRSLPSSSRGSLMRSSSRRCHGFPPPTCRSTRPDWPRR
ncbi:MAG: hypothetical protein ACR2HK_11730 [Gemmatimonadales bacterium]